jgi:serine/threonine-protein kinase
MSEEDRAFLQRRVALFGLIIGLIFLGGFIFRTVIIAAVSEDVHGDFRDADYIFHSVAIVFLLAIWLLCRSRSRSARFIRTVESIGLVAACTSLVLMGAAIKMGAGPELIVVLCLTWILVARATYIPSSARRTLLIGFVIGIPLIGMTYFKFLGTVPAEMSSRGFVGLSGAEAGRLGAIVTSVYWITSVAVSTGASKVIYGLRKDIRGVKQLGQYALVRKLGEGGMGAVYEAKHVLLRRPTAVKLIRQGRFAEESLARFVREVQLTAKLTHPNTVTIFDYGRTPDGVFYYAMELLDGATLRDIVQLCGRQPAARVVHILAQVAGALSEAHAVGLVHRDIKPANIMLCRQGGVPDVAKVLDFGLVKDVGEDVDPSVSRAGVIKGTPHYMAPEAITAPDSVDARSDLYALGAVGYYLVTGHHLFTGKSVMEVCMQHVQDNPPPPSERLGEPVPASLESLILDCLAKNPTRRPQSAADLQMRIRGCEEIGDWDGNWWWEEYGEAIRVHIQESRSMPDALTLDVGLAERPQQRLLDSDIND